MRLLICLAFVLCTPWLGMPAAHAQFIWDDIERVVAIGDVHGAYPALVSLLKASGVVDDNLAWQGGSTHLVSLGDLLDRGPESRKAMDLLMRLQTEAKSSGGHVHVVLGNHEIMNLSGDLRDVSEAEMTALEPLGGHRAAFAVDGYYGSWLLTLPFVIRINENVFAHGGFGKVVADDDLITINKTASAALRAVLNEGARLRESGLLPPEGDLLSLAFDLTEEQQLALGELFNAAIRSPLLGPYSPQWYRGTAACHGIIERPILQQALTNLRATRAVMGHTPTLNREVNARFDGQAVMIDTGMLASAYRGKPRAIEISGNRVRAFGISGDTPITYLPQPDPVAILAEADYTLTVDETSSLLTFANSGLTARFERLNKRNTNRALAAYRLDRLLGLYMVPTTVARNIEGKNGVVIAWPRTISEAERAAAELARPNYCQGTSDFELLAAFDALIGKRDRTAENLHYQRSNWQIHLSENHEAFDTSSRLPQYVSVPNLPKAMADKLAALDEAMLSEALGTTLKRRELKAVLKRRDAILDWPQSN